MTLHGSTRQQQIDLIVIIAVSLQVLDTAECRLSICYGCIQVMLLAVFVDAEAFEIDVLARTELRLDRARDIDGALHAELLHAALHNVELDRDGAGHFDGSAKRDLSVTLTEVQVSD